MSLIDPNTFAIIAPGVTPPAWAIMPGGVDLVGPIGAPVPIGEMIMPTFDLNPGFFETNPGGLYALPNDGFQTVDPASVAILNPSSTNWGNIAGAVASFGTTLANVINSLKNNTPLGANAQPPGVTAKPLVSQTALPWLLVGGTLIAAFLIFGFRK